MTLDQAILNLEENTINANSVKNAIFKKLYQDKIITEEQYEELVIKYNIIIVKKGWFKIWLEKREKNENPDAYIYKVIEME